MSSQNQYSPAPTAAGVRQANLEAALRITTIMAAASARLFKVQSEAANAAFAENSRHLTAMLKTLETKDSAALLAEWTSLYQANMRRVLDVTRSCFQMVPETQAEIAKVVGDPLATANGQTQQYLDQFTKALNDGRDLASASMRDFLAQSAPSASETPSANKEPVT